MSFVLFEDCKIYGHLFWYLRRQHKILMFLIRNILIDKPDL